MAVKFKNNFDLYKADFKKDTGKEWNEDIAIYIAYFNARTSDTTMQITAGFYHDGINTLEHILKKD